MRFQRSACKGPIAIDLVPSLAAGGMSCAFRLLKRIIALSPDLMWTISWIAILPQLPRLQLPRVRIRMQNSVRP
jgi:hypothetical protein